MGRGRQKAKQTKVARQLKYYSPETDYNALQRELSGDRPRNNSHEQRDQSDTDEYAEYADKYAVDEPDDERHTGTR